MDVISIFVRPFNLGIILDGLAYSIVKVCMCSVGAEGDDILVHERSSAQDCSEWCSGPSLSITLFQFWKAILTAKKKMGLYIHQNESRSRKLRGPLDPMRLVVPSSEVDLVERATCWNLKACFGTTPLNQTQSVQGFTWARGLMLFHVRTSLRKTPTVSPIHNPSKRILSKR